MIELSPIVIIVFVLILISSTIKIVPEYERGVVFRLGRLQEFRGPGLTYVLPMIENMTRIDMRTITMDVPPQDVITRDNVSVKVNAVVYFRVVDPNKAIVQIENYLFATSQLAQTTLRSICGQQELDDLLSERDKINARLQEILDVQTDPWGIKVSLVEIKHIDLPQEMQRAIAKQAEAERERRAKAAQRLADASVIIEQHPVALQLRYLQTLSEVATENNSTTLFPVPIDLLAPFLSGKRTT
jgi:regulator of protease activity HflC (stomatin/prohibitin superfamily)